MLTPSQIVHAAHGSTVVGSCFEVPGICYLCGGTVARGQSTDDWMGDGFTSQVLCAAPFSPVVCEACCYVISRVSPVLGRPPKNGKAFGGNFRNYSSCYDERGYFNASKGEKPLIREFLERDHAEPWFCAVADSGQKHVIPFARMNGPGRAGLVLFDEQVIAVPVNVSLIAEMTDLLTAGITKDEIGSSDYYARSWKESRAHIEQFEATHGSGRGGGWFTLALWLAQRNEVEHAGFTAEKTARNAVRRIDPGAKKRVPPRTGRKATNDILDNAAGPDPQCGAPDVDSKRMGKLDAAKAADRRSGQGRLFDLG